MLHPFVLNMPSLIILKMILRWAGLDDMIPVYYMGKKLVVAIPHLPSMLSPSHRFPMCMGGWNIQVPQTWG